MCPNVKSGYFWIGGNSGSTEYEVFCEMETAQGKRCCVKLLVRLTISNKIVKSLVSRMFFNIVKWKWKRLGRLKAFHIIYL